LQAEVGINAAQQWSISAYSEGVGADSAAEGGFRPILAANVTAQGLRMREPFVEEGLPMNYLPYLGSYLPIST
jgi:hypothetical protein